MHIVAGLPEHAVRMRSQEASGYELSDQIVGVYWLQVAVEREARECSWCMRRRDIRHGRHLFWAFRLLVVDVARFGPPAHREGDVAACCVVLEGCRYVDCQEGWVAVAFAVALEYDKIC